jgi:hypothetical protein
MVRVMILDYIKRLLKQYPPVPRSRFNTESKGDMTITTGNFTVGTSGGITFTSNPNTTLKMSPMPIDRLVSSVANKIDNKSLSDYEFREWLRDNLSSCEYQSENSPRKYTKPDDTRPISVIDAMLEVK